MNGRKIPGTFGHHVHRALDESLKRREVRTERMINYVRIVVLAIGFALDIAGATRTGVASGRYIGFVIGLVTIVALYLGAVHWSTTPGRYRQWIKYVTITLDFGILVVYAVVIMDPGLRSLGGIDAMVGVLVSAVAFVVLESALRLDRLTIIYGTTLGTAGAVAAALAFGASEMLQIWAGPFVALVGAITFWISTSVRDTLAALVRREKLARFLPRELVELVEQGDGEIELGGKETTATVMFADIRGFTRLSEKRSPEVVVQFLNSFFTEMARLVLDHGGMLDKFVGDEVMAVFGAPMAREDDATRALACARAMLESLARMNASRRPDGLPEIAIGIALHTGPVVAGNIGSPERMEYTVIGDTVNVAARVEELNKRYHTSILLTGTTRDALNGSFAGREIAAVPIRGREQRVRLYTV